MKPRSFAPHLALAAAVVLACAGAPRPARAAAADTALVVPDVPEYQRLLDDYLVVVSKRGEPLDTRFDYERLYDVRTRPETFARIHRQLAAATPSRMDRATRLAWAINTYNFLVLENATDYLLVPGRGRLRWKSVQDIHLRTGLFFKGETIEVEGVNYSLDDFERAFCLDGYDRSSGQTPPATLDPRVHFALVCGAMGCPPLLPRAYRADSLERQLEFATHNALALPRHLVLDPATKRVGVSTLFSWYAADFGGNVAAWAFVKRYAPKPVRAAIEAQKLQRPNRYVPWDWLLNQAPKKTDA